MKKRYLLLLTPAILMLGCQPKSSTPTPATPATVTACFTASKTLVDSGEAITFTNCSTNAASYLWSLGDSQSTQTNPVHAYKAARTSYTVQLTAYNADKSQSPKVIQTVYLGHRKFDSVRINSIASPTFVSGKDYVLQFGPTQNISQYSVIKTGITSLPTTFSLNPKTLNDSVYIVHGKNDNGWRGHIFSNPIGTYTVSFGLNPTTPILLSRGVNVSPIHVVDNGVDMLWYYHMVK